MAKKTIGHDDTLYAVRPGKAPEALKPPLPGRIRTEVGLFHTTEDQIGAHPQEKENLDGPIGSVIDGKYQITSKLGEGEFGIVYKAIHMGLNKEVVIKISKDVKSEESQLRFKREARTLASVRHENVVLITDYGKTEEGKLYLVMEYYDGEDLEAKLRRMGRIELEDAIEIMIQVCHGLCAVHSKGITHRDMKPANIFLSKSTGKADIVKLLDFGIAKAGEGQQQVFNAANNVTKANLISGTPDYMSPEQAAGLFDHRSDIYATGIIFYEMLCGMPPFDAPTPIDILHKHMHEKVVPIREARPDLCLPPEVDMVLLKALEKNKDKRFQGVGELEAALRAIPLTRVAPDLPLKEQKEGEQDASRDDESRTVQSPTLQVHRRSTYIAVAIGAAAAIAAGVATTFLTRNSNQGKASVVYVQGDPKPRETPTSAPAEYASQFEEKKKTSRIRIVTEPAGADVSVGGKKEGTTPFDAEFPKGSEKVEFTVSKPGYETEKIEAILDENKEFDRKLLQKKANGKEHRKQVKKDKKPGKKKLEDIIRLPE